MILTAFFQIQSISVLHDFIPNLFDPVFRRAVDVVKTTLLLLLCAKSVASQTNRGEAW